jgi:hypothetical protein
MGLTIHYGLKHSGNDAAALVAKLRQRALDLPFTEVGEIVDLGGAACDFDQRDRDDPNRWLLIQAGRYVDDPLNNGRSYGLAPTRVIAFSTWPGEGCEAANFGLLCGGSHNNPLWRSWLCGVQHDFSAISRVGAVLDAT